MKWILKAPGSGQYDLRCSYSPNPNRAANVPVNITYRGETKTVVVNQKETPEIDGLFHHLDVLKLNADDTVEVVVSNEGTNGHVIADAVQLEPVK